MFIVNISIHCDIILSLMYFNSVMFLNDWVVINTICKKFHTEPRPIKLQNWQSLWHQEVIFNNIHFDFYRTLVPWPKLQQLYLLLLLFQHWLLFKLLLIIQFLHFKKTRTNHRHLWRETYWLFHLVWINTKYNEMIH